MHQHVTLGNILSNTGRRLKMLYIYGNYIINLYENLIRESDWNTKDCFSTKGGGVYSCLANGKFLQQKYKYMI